MAKTSKIEKSKRLKGHSTRDHHRCQLCGRPRGVIRIFGLCRLCFRELAHKGELPGVYKMSK
ncbi:TPA: type Z 30S ribosomal protein S14 [Candidatus Collierbacteria bacterium]|nr:MAG: 30S ribosomal protein S14 type Z [Candidatus Collierbacteria bacterium GW2011_GWE2_42_48]KKS63145.1 MAG: 30S ribosomal protein S14 type Z [Candidatus Collierbacteria bacterium GW2011_GWD2_42_50]KKS63493.1 MAG: 30S ribosomal protein S14 type Z [Candidatus Collierbacteria bacterium GW2011_GWF1_42_50]KKS64957.1 MAG: 30S ribosomal protein S14 type Z [Candidatus Collierbacteria bacterium GW2011_GWF2_42_51]HAI22597.1 type Z 30S ribosomal protein S14 [Candidatus Collierbacteria bacterium]